ncbi:two-component system, NtrC family, response regulator AlgB [Verrucomicrobium sp. GAS474]|uniref:sigma-54-dependent transcriptional regulator n=1 Tax=Verrucomicrobium sp. GAS474 TaxID=1882831 RepID=UPI00087AE0A9|nr:sigma-54 dependent transcriptional regulator [Verrucomicrobium sp. GAS474]SDU13050.1 two-component system, NtrC family, response regulator AlgB [Verrucomicrobium sp. GAS474]
MKILIVDDEKNIRTSTSLAIQSEGHEPDAVDSGRIALMKMAEEPYDLVFLDLRIGEEDGLEVLDSIVKLFPNVPTCVFTAHASITSAVEAMRRGAFDYLEKPFTPGQLRNIVGMVERMRKLNQRVSDLEQQVSVQSPTVEYVSEDPAMAKVMDVLNRTAGTKAAVLILGESGTGKSVLARYVHDHSELKDKPFVTISCPSLSRELLESELFGHVKGAFTGAVKDTWGKVDAAKGGTLFLDEIGELPLEIQPKLLRLLQERQYERVGDNKTRTADVRVIAATNRNMEECVREKTFREDLYYRLNVISVTTPPLRHRAVDLKRLSQNFVRFFAKQIRRPVKEFSPQALERILAYPWPGNIRELRNAIERAVILAQGTTIELSDLPEHLSAKQERRELMPGSPVTLEELEFEHIRLVVERAENLESAARTLGIDPATLYRKRKKMDHLLAEPAPSS